MTLEQMASGATLPWNSLDAVAEEWRRAGLPVVTSAELSKCMNCKAPECYNCIDGGTPAGAGRPSKKFVLDEQLALFETVDGYGHEYETVEKEISTPSKIEAD